MRYCGNCGASLSPDIGGYDGFDGYGGYGAVCPSCGEHIRPMDDLEAVHTVDIAHEPTHRPLSVLNSEYLPGLSASAERADTDPPTMMRRATWRFPFKPMALLALLAVTLLLALGSALLLNNALRNQPSSLTASGSADKNAHDAHSAATVSVSPYTAQPTTTGNVLSGPLASPAISPAPGSTATTQTSSGAVATPTPAPTLAVAPLTITLGTCVSARTQFTVTNTGGGTMSWSASASRTLYNVSPQGGFLSSGQQQTVTVSNITLNGSITVSAAGAASAPQTVTITCTL